MSFADATEVDLVFITGHLADGPQEWKPSVFLCRVFLADEIINTKRRACREGTAIHSEADVNKAHTETQTSVRRRHRQIKTLCIFAVKIPGNGAHHPPFFAHDLLLDEHPQDISGGSRFGSRLQISAARCERGRKPEGTAAGDQFRHEISSNADPAVDSNACVFGHRFGIVAVQDSIIAFGPRT